MKGRVLIALGILAGTSAHLAAAEDRLAQGIYREAGRVAAAAQASRDPYSDWSRVRALVAGTEVQLTVRDALRVRISVLSVTETELIVLNLLYPRLPYAVMQTLTALAMTHSALLIAPGPDQVFQNGNVRIDGTGISVNGAHIARLEEVVLRIARRDVVEITKESPRRRSHKLHGALIGLGVGVGATFLARAQSTGADADLVFLYAPHWGGLGAGIGFGVGALIDHSDTGQTVIYRVPSAP